MAQNSSSSTFHLNDLKAFGAPLTAAERASIGKAAPELVRPYLSLWGPIEETPLIPLPGIAAVTGTGQVFLKNEATRLELGTFKALGGAYAVMVLFRKLLETHLSRPVEIAELLSDHARHFAKSVTLCCATDGNHGKSVAAGARLLGCRSVIFVHKGVSDARIKALRGDEVVRVDGSYDLSVSESERVGREQGWHLVSDTSWSGYEEIPAMVSQGYTVIADEALRQLAGLGHSPPTHVFLQAGVGGFASSISGHFKDRLGAKSPVAIIVEPDRAACVFASAKAGKLVSIAHGEPTLMAMLEFFTPSLVAWHILEKTASAFMTVGEEDAKRALRMLAFPKGNDPAIVAGESGAAGCAGLLALSADKAACARLRLGKESRILVINTETASDPSSYEAIVGASPQEIGKDALRVA